MSAYVLALFLTVYGVFFLYTSRTIKTDAAAKLLSVQTFLFMFGILYFALAHFSVYSALVYDTQYALVPQCEYLPGNSTTAGSLTTYAFYNTCANDTYPEGQHALLTSYTWILYMNLVALMLGSFFLIVARAYKKW